MAYGSLLESGIFDTHAHYDDRRFDEDRYEVLDELFGSGKLYAAVGIHPENCGDFVPAHIAALRELAKHEKVVAIGEIGLDYYWAENPSKEFQQEVFRQQLRLALELDLPVIIHDREAHGDTLAIVKEFPYLRGVFHCYSGSVEMAQELIKMGWYLGFDGPLTYKNARKTVEVAEAIPLERIVVETDSPYLSPVPMRGKRNDSRNIPYILGKLAEIRGISAAEAEAITCQNGKKLFGID